MFSHRNANKFVSLELGVCNTVPPTMIWVFKGWTRAIALIIHLGYYMAEECL